MKSALVVPALLLAALLTAKDWEGLRKFLESNGHKFVVTSDKDGPNSVLEREIVDA